MAYGNDDVQRPASYGTPRGRTPGGPRNVFPLPGGVQMKRKLLSDELESQLKDLGSLGIDKIHETLAEKADEETDEWKKGIYALVIDAVDTFGPLGINKALNLVHDLVDGKVVAIGWVDLEKASDLVASLQNQEAAKKKASRVFLVKLGEILTDVATGVIKALV
jgi:hypothetical protein